MGVIVALELGGFEKEALVEEFGDGEDFSARGGGADKGVGHLSFEKKAVVEDDVGGHEPADVGAGGLVEVRIDPLAHQALDGGAVGGDGGNDVGDHADSAEDGESGRRVGGGEAAARRGEQGGEGEKREKSRSRHRG